MVGVYLEEMYRVPAEVHRIKYLLAGLQDVVRVFRSAIHVEPARFVDEFSAEIHGLLKTVRTRTCTFSAVHVHAASVIFARMIVTSVCVCVCVYARARRG